MALSLLQLADASCLISLSLNFFNINFHDSVIGSGIREDAKFVIRGYRSIFIAAGRCRLFNVTILGVKIKGEEEGL